LVRQRFIFDYLIKLKENQEELAKVIVKEQGKTMLDARGDIQRGLEVVEHCLSFSSLMMGETSANIARGVDLFNFRVPLGVCAGVAAFNFPVMIPLWMFPVAITLGNTYILKPSEKVAGASQILGQLLNDIKLPTGVVNIVHGGRQTVTNICTHPKIKAISFVGSNQGGEYVWETGTKHGKRVQSNMGAKNHGIILPDAEKEDALNQLASAAFGASGQRCMALTCAVFVGESQQWIPELVEKAKNLKVGAGSDAGVDVGPLIDKAVIFQMITSSNNFRLKKESLEWSERLMNKVLRSSSMELSSYIPNILKETSLLLPSLIM
jgi:malonate-semialdehyde dehydrogenase (acetylating)/methylmalonate-semialdehyde dehydrogenase